MHNRVYASSEQRNCPGKAANKSLKDAWAKKNVEAIQYDLSSTLRQEGQIHGSRSKTAEQWAIRKWRERWEHYLSTVPPAKRTPAHDGDLGRQRDKLHQGSKSKKLSSDSTSDG